MRGFGGRLGESVEALRYLTDDERTTLLARAERDEYAPGAVILTEGEPQEAIFVIISGKARVEKDTPGGRTQIDELTPGESFGEMSFLDGTLTSGSVVASEPVVVDVLRLDAVADLLEEDPYLASHLYHSLAVMLARRLRDRTDQALPKNRA